MSRLLPALLPALLLAALAAAAPGCASNPERQVLRTAGTAVELTAVPFFAQDEFQCGPAALATVLQADAVDITPEQLVPEIYVPGRRGSLQAELLAATRRHGRVPYVLPPALAPVLAELRAGRPVLVLQNLGLERWPVWHYAVLVGFDPEREIFLLRSGEQARRQTRAAPFLASWARAGHWAMVVSDPAQLPVSAEPARWLQAVAPFESTGALATASAGYEAAVARWPDEPQVWTALGNIRYRQQRLQDAEPAYRRALTLATDPQAAAGWSARNNLVQSLLERHCTDAAQTAVNEAGTAPAAQADSWAKTRARALGAEPDACE